jgi:hypothetical protein
MFGLTNAASSNTHLCTHANTQMVGRTLMQSISGAAGRRGYVRYLERGPCCLPSPLRRCRGGRRRAGEGCGCWRRPGCRLRTWSSGPSAEAINSGPPQPLLFMCAQLRVWGGESAGANLSEVGGVREMKAHARGLTDAPEEGDRRRLMRGGGGWCTPTGEAGEAVHDG